MRSDNKSVLLVILALASQVEGHASLFEPPNRSSLWRFPEFESFHPIINSDDNQVYCGGFTIQHSQNGGKCGICGDDYSQRRPRNNESGGKYDIGLVVRNYTKGSNIFTSTLITANHLGHFEFSLCVRNSRGQPEDDQCFDEYPLPRSDGEGFRSYPVFIGGTLGYFNVSVSLPPMVTCTHCVLRWQYVTGNTWGMCRDGEESHGHDPVTSQGCGPQEEFRGCADIAIFNP